MAKYNRNDLGPYKNSDQEWSERLRHTGESAGGGEPGRQDVDTFRERNAGRRLDRNDVRSKQGVRNTERASYGGPYDVGNYASHYDDYNREGEQAGITFQRSSGKPDHRGKGPRGYQRSDERILEDINDRLYLDPYVDASGIEATVDKCDVTLTGTVEDRNAKRMAEDVAYSIPGVKNVENRIRIAKTHTAGPVRSNVRDELM